MMAAWKPFVPALVVSAAALAGAFAWGSWMGLYLAAVLGMLEVSLSFDNAVLNASVLRMMDARWQQLFLTVGIVIAVFVVRFVFPLVIVAVATGLGVDEVGRMALGDPERYAHHLYEAHVEIAAFGGIFLLLVFFSFLFDDTRELHWMGTPERLMGGLGRMESVGIVFALAALLVLQMVLPEPDRASALIAGIVGIMVFVVVDGIDALFGTDSLEGAAKRSGAMGFLYLEFLDASFSLDGVIGAFAITRDVVIILLGLGIGAMFVRSLTVMLVRRGTLERHVFLEHGAFYAIGVLGTIMLVTTVQPVPEWLTGLVGIVFIAFSLISSLRRERRGRP